MNTHKIKLLIGISIGILVLAYGTSLTRSNASKSLPIKNGQEKQPQTVATLPLIVSNVKDIEVVKATLKNKGTPDAVASIELKNKSNKAILAVSVETGRPDEAYGVTVNGFSEGDEAPEAVIQPHGFLMVEFSLYNIKPGDPIRVSGVVYADGSEDGEKTALETIHGQRERAKSQKAKSRISPAKKGGFPER